MKISSAFKGLLVVSLLCLLCYPLIVNWFVNENYSEAYRLDHWYNHGLDYQPERIEYLYSQAIKEEPKNLGFLRSRASFYMSTYQYEKASVDLRAYLNIESHPYIYFELGKSLALSYRYKEALDSFQQAIKLQPTNVQFWAPYGILQVINDDLEGALNSMANEISYSGGKSWKSYLWGVVLLCSGKEDEAVQYFNEVIIFTTAKGVVKGEVFDEKNYYYDGELEVNRNRSCGKETLVRLLEGGSKSYLAKVRDEYSERYVK